MLFCKKKAADGYYELANADDVKWFSERVWTYRYNELGASDVSNDECNAPLNARLTADIDFDGVNDYRPIGGLWGHGGTRYTGTFDGQGHIISKLTISNGYDNQGFFGVISNGAVIKNMLLDNTCSISAQSAVGFIGKVWKSTGGDVYIQNCGNEATITSSGSNAGGILGVNQNNSGYVVLHMENCFNTGNVSGNQSGGLTGWTGDNAVLTNCYTAGSSSATDFFARTSGSCTLTNCYTTVSRSGVTTITSDQVNNGELAYKLDNTVWHQTIGTDRHPYPFSGDHMVVSKDNDDYYNGSNLISIASGSELNTFATDYNNGMYAGACKVVLTRDLDMGGISYPGIGVDSHYFVGVLDGQGYIISNLSMKDKDINHDNIGFINAANAPSTIRNLTLDNSCSIDVSGKKYVGGIMGACFGDGIVSFYNCGNEAAITANKNPGGILGCNLSGGVTIQMKNCYNTGAIEGEYDGSEGGGISGWLGNNSKLTNCYSTGNVTNGEAFARGNSATVTNCYTRVTSSGGNHVDANYTKTADEFADGTVFAELFDYTNADPAVNGNVWRMEFSGTPHPVLYDAAMVLKEDFPNRPKSGRTGNVSLYRTIKQGGWNTFCVPFDMTSAQITAYFGADTEVAVLDESKDGSDGVLHFKVVDEIEAGQAYLVYPGVAEDFSSKAIEGVTISATSPQVGITQAGFTFKGVYEPTALVAAEDRIVVSGNKIVKTTGGSLNGFRAYFKPTDANARATRFVIDDDDEVTGIITAEGEVIMDQPVYNLRGQRVQEGNSSSRGLLIKGGKKYVKM